MKACWYLSDGSKLLPKCPFGLMGIVNLTPDSFYDGGKNLVDGSYLSLVGEMISVGADIIDLGAESTRPGAAPISSASEQDRLLPALDILSKSYPDAIFSIDTYHASTAALAMENGAHIINDISACSYDPALVDVLAQYKPGYVLMHSQGRPSYMQNNPRYENIIDDMMFFFEEKLSNLFRSGLPENRIVLDPGIGFGKNLAHNLSIFQNMDQFKKFGRPILLGLSMKSFFGQLMGLPLEKRGPVTMIAMALMWEKGVFWHRVHDIEEAGKALALACRMQKECDWLSH